MRLGYQARGNQNATVSGNYAAGMGAGTTGLLSVKNFDSGTIRNNLFYSWDANKAVASLDRTGGRAGFPLAWDFNSYYAANNWGFVTNNALPSLRFTEWRAATGYDPHSSCSKGGPNDIVAFTRRNKYDPARSHVVVFNWVGATSFPYDLATAGLRAGDRFEIRDAQNYVGAPVLTGTYNGALIRLPLDLTEVAPIYGTITHFANVHTPPTFNVFVVQGPLGSGSAGRPKPKPKGR
jgi:hypothetical protein